MQILRMWTVWRLACGQMVRCIGVNVVVAVVAVAVVEVVEVCEGKGHRKEDAARHLASTLGSCDGSQGFGAVRKNGWFCTSGSAQSHQHHPLWLA